MAKRRRRSASGRFVKRRRVTRRRRRNTATVQANPRRRRRRRKVTRRRAPRRRTYRRRRRNPTPLMAKTMYTNPRRRRRKRRAPARRRRRSYRRNPRFKFLPTMAQVRMSLWGGGGFLVNKISGNMALYGMVRFVPGFNTLPMIAKALVTPIVGTAIATTIVNFFPKKGRTYAQAGVNIALGYGLLQALLGTTGLAARLHPVLAASLQGDDYVSSGALADYVTAGIGMGDYVQAPALGEAELPGYVAASGIEPYMSSGSLGAGHGYGNLKDMYYGV